ncbi:RNA-binding S4 domain-containing protein [Pelosinus fermentans]|uniref:Putative RNA binding protein n=1 Tax=Pelosinus fermentans JBW45 TaxID=1192197 RepID=I9NU67_9FIRM|nr:RNA-binding S4 domain-containing protein [Pelosinus fermentans]AJQ25360.1 putative RNA binding protein [Pelosinus fermentans JBW45]
MEEIGISTTTIQLDQFLKWAGIIESGGQVKLLIEDGLVFINGTQIHERRKKIQPGDIVEITDIGKWKVTTE